MSACGKSHGVGCTHITVDLQDLDNIYDLHANYGGPIIMQMTMYLRSCLMKCY